MTTLRTAEHCLGFETNFFSREGLPEEKVQMVFTSNSRPTSTAMEKDILEYWKQHRTAGQFDGDRVRFEGLHYRRKDECLTVSYSYEKYRTYFFFTRKKFPKAYHPRLLGAYLIIITKDGMIPIGLREQPEGHSEWWSIAPAGYVDVMRISRGNRWRAETFWNTAARESEEELAAPEKLDKSKIRLIGVFSSYATNWDVDATMVARVSYDSSEIRLKGSEHESLKFLETSEESLREELQEIVQKRASFGYLGANIALLLGHLYGLDDYRQTLEKIVRHSKQI